MKVPKFEMLAKSPESGNVRFGSSAKLEKVNFSVKANPLQRQIDS